MSRANLHVDTQVLKHEAPGEWWWRSDVSAATEDGLTRCELWRLFPPTPEGQAAAAELAKWLTNAVPWVELEEAAMEGDCAERDGYVAWGYRITEGAEPAPAPREPAAVAALRRLMAAVFEFDAENDRSSISSERAVILSAAMERAEAVLAGQAAGAGVQHAGYSWGHLAGDLPTGTYCGMVGNAVGYFDADCPHCWRARTTRAEAECARLRASGWQCFEGLRLTCKRCAPPDADFNNPYGYGDCDDCQGHGLRYETRLTRAEATPPAPPEGERAERLLDLLHAYGKASYDRGLAVGEFLAIPARQERELDDARTATATKRDEQAAARTALLAALEGAG